MSDWQHAGVDWAGGHWVAVVLNGEEEPRVTVEESMANLWNRLEDPSLVLVGVPIGLPDSETLEHREALDSWARSQTERPSSVFPVPSRCAAWAAAADYPHDEVSAINRKLLDKGLSTQSYAISDAIAEVDWFLYGSDLDDRIAESHPEVCFVDLNEGEPLEHSKHAAAGATERLAILGEYVEFPEDGSTCLTQELSKAPDVQVDDLLDATVLAITASEAKLERFDYTVDAAGRPMRMVHAEQYLEPAPTSRS